jgi:TRAP-type C4-dicarboxylate transport system permease small subunit
MHNGDAPIRQPMVDETRVGRFAAAIAVLGGFVALGLALIVVTSVLGRWLFDAPLTGDWEFVKMGTAVAVFSFLPYCQARRGNIFVDTFTSWLPARVTAAIDALWDLVYAGMAGIICVCLINGTLDTYRSGETTMMLQLIAWPAIAMCAALCFLLTLVALLSSVLRLRSGA